MNKPFFDPNYAVMRHAYDVGLAPSISIHPDSVTILRRVANEFAQKIVGKPVRILHSPLRRAELTAEMMRDGLLGNGISVVGTEPADWLSCEKYYINQQRVIDLLQVNLGTFVLLISHQPDIERYLNQYSGVSNCSVFAGEFNIRGH